MRVSRFVQVGVLGIFALGFTSLFGAPALADTVPAEPEIVNVPMIPVEFDEELAQKNGFEIRTNSDGTAQSLPVTDEARKLVAEFPELAEPVKLQTPVKNRDGVTPFAGDGACGTSYIIVVPLSAQGGVNVTTGYASYMGTVVFHNWKVALSTSSASTTVNFTGYNWSNTWSDYKFTSLRGYAHGIAGMTSDSYVRHVNTLKCVPANNTASW